MKDIKVTDRATNEDIGLVDFLKILWNSKLIITVCTSVFTLIAIVYAFTAQQWWTSQAIVTEVQYTSNANIKEELINLYTVVNDDSKINQVLTREALFKAYITEFNAFDNKKEFISNNEIMKQYYSDGENNNKNRFINKWSKNISAREDKKNSSNLFELSFKATTPKLAYDLLESYSEFVSNKVRDEVLEELNAKIRFNQKLYSQNLLVQESIAKKKLYNEEVKTNYALDIAKSANALKPMAEMSSNQLFGIDLGSEALAEKSKILSQIKDLSIIDPSLSTAKVRSDLVNAVRLNKDANLQSVRYLQKISLPIDRSKPMRGLIIALSFIFGLMISMIFVLLRGKLSK
ncbi:Wzz/FepE/Etk N-terminal domain-containing protein [Photobacterium angustum]|uniref:Chain-length determining protein n=1 Tax=Photobacterium angustum TaxID=661 RepID=A0A2S7VWW8_PHOAN|nr:Wzz/FepE/Etk N-terminal domain-containing protein [Photobacterium angustum]PQJ66263.1 chain-length determining protein [Photobacterium angustum]